MDGVVRVIDIAGRKVGDGQPCFVIAEAGVNHDGSVEMARRLVDVAAEARADAIKFQTFKAATLVSRRAPKAAYQQASTGVDESQLEMVKRLELPFSAFREIADRCRERGILFLSTPFEEESATFLDGLGVPAFKIPSGEITNLPLLAHVASMGKPMIVSTGMANLAEVEAAVRTIEDAGNRQLILLHCVSAYPADPADANLRAMRTLSSAFGVPTGFSDHTPGTTVALAAVALGACVVEKHFTLDRSLPGPDHAASLEPAELSALVKEIRTVEAALGSGNKVPVTGELDTAAVARKSLVTAREIPAGTALTADVIAIKRPGTGLPPRMLMELVGRIAALDIPADTVISWDMLR